MNTRAIKLNIFENPSIRRRIEMVGKCSHEEILESVCTTDQRSSFTLHVKGLRQIFLVYMLINFTGLHIDLSCVYYTDKA